jgi:hypothetical protein
VQTCHRTDGLLFGATFAVLFGLVAFMGVWTVMLMRYFRRVPQALLRNTKES